MLAKRYRIIGLLGRGGMGEVYRADDLKLGQPVALKFLPREVERDEGRLQRFLNEVRMALKVSHPNVTRVHDIGEVDGQHYISMEFVDGEDLSSLLRRIGRLPPDKAVQVARQLCAGLAAAHDQGVLHRDLKPANVMLDGRGQVKITDFGLAGLEETIDGAEAQAGTPAYMAPEQWAGQEVTAQSDLYALGSVLYELFTGEAVFSGKTPAEILKLQQDESSAVTSPSTVIEGIDASVERVILSCLHKDPRQRPASALAISAGLPGGDPLAAALAAGETPSPELVAQAGGTEGLSARTAIGLLIMILVGIGVWVGVAPLVQLVGLVPPPKPPEVLVERAREIIREVGYEAAPRDSVYDFVANVPYVRHLRDAGSSLARWESLKITQPAALKFRYRESPKAIMKFAAGSRGELMEDPPMDLPGMVRVELDPQGNLLSLLAVPPEIASPNVSSSEQPDWQSLLASAGLDSTKLTSKPSNWYPPVFANQRVAWEGSYPEAPEVAIRIEAAGLEGRVVAFRIFEPWNQPALDPSTQRSTLGKLSDLMVIVMWLSALVGAVLVALRNLRLGRGDHKTALRFALYLGIVRLIWLVGGHHVAGLDELGTILSNLAWSAFRLVLVWVFYIALEPYVRRLWPRVLVTWVRLFGGRWRDPQVGRDVLVGVAWGLTILLLFWFQQWALPRLSGVAWGGPYTFWSIFEPLRGTRFAVGSLAVTHTFALLNDTLMVLLLFVILRLIFRRTWIAATVMTLAQLVLRWPTEGNPFPFAAIFLVFALLYLLVLFRVGFLSVAVGISVYRLLEATPMTYHVSSWYFSATLLTVALVLALTAYAFRVSLAGRPVLTDEILSGPAS